jgi:hypothetical protein
MRCLGVFVLLFVFTISSLGQETNSFWEGVEIEFDFNPTISFGMGTADYTRDVLPHLTPQNDKMNLLQDEFYETNPINIDAYGNDYGDCCWDPPMPNSLLFAVKVQKPISTQYVKNLFYLGAFVQYGKNSLGKSLRNGDYGLFSDNPYRNTAYFNEPNKFDTVAFKYFDYTDTMVFNRAKMATFDNPRNTVQLGVNFKTVLFKSKKERFRISADLAGSFIWATSNNIKVYTQYYDFESLNYYQEVYSGNKVIKSNTYNKDYLVSSKHLNKSYVGERQMLVAAPLLYGSSFSLGLGFDYKLIKKLPLKFGVNLITASQVFKRQGEVVGTNRMLTVGYSVIYTL